MRCAFSYRREESVVCWFGLAREVSNDHGWEQGVLAIVQRMEISLYVFPRVRSDMAAFSAACRVSILDSGATARQVGKENLPLSALPARKQQIPIAWP
jgi:hypothetical protein